MAALSPIIDLNNFLALVGGDPRTAVDLIVAFRICIDEQMQKLTQALACDNASDWHDAAHALKGVYLNLGAAGLGDLCRKAQHDYKEDKGHKRILLGEILKEDHLLQDYLRRFSNSCAAAATACPDALHPAFVSGMDA